MSIGKLKLFVQMFEALPINVKRIEGHLNEAIIASVSTSASDFMTFMISEINWCSNHRIT